MALDADKMKENPIFSDDGDPLSTKPPFGGAEAKPLNSEKTNLTPQDLHFIADTVHSAIGIYPPDAPWHDPKETWPGVLKSRKEPIIWANRAIHEHFVETNGENSEIAQITGILSELTPEITQIAILQFEQGFTGSKSWREVDPEASAELSKKIKSILADNGKSKLFAENPTVKAGLEFINDVLIPSNDPVLINKAYSEYTRLCIDANATGKPIIYIPFESDFTKPVLSESERTQICEAMVSVVMPMEKTERDSFDRLTTATWELLRQRGTPHQINTRINMIVGYNVMESGFGAFDSTVGMAFVLKSKGSHEHGFYLAINNLAKKSKFWQASTELLNTHVSSDHQTFSNILTLLYAAHEQSHRLYPEQGTFGEVPADIPAVILALKIAMAPELIGNEYTFQPEEVVAGILTEYVSEIINSVSRDDLFEGHSSNTGNELFDGYLLSAVVIMNAMVESGIVRANEFGKIDVDLSPDKLAKLFEDLEMIDGEFHKKNQRVLDKIRLAVANPEAIKIIELYRDNVDSVTPVVTASLQKMVK